MNATVIIPDGRSAGDEFGAHDSAEQIDQQTHCDVMSGTGELCQQAATEPGAKHLLFVLEETRYAVPIENVLELQRLPRITRLPNVPRWLRGVTNLHGEVLSVIDLRALLGLPVPDRSSSQRLIVVRSTREEIAMGWIVDRIVGIRPFSREELTPSSLLSDQPAAIIVRTVAQREGHQVLVLDVDRVLASPELRQFDEAR